MYARKVYSTEDRKGVFGEGGEITERGARSVAQGIDVKIKRVAGPLIAEKQFFDEVAEYHKSGKIPERYIKKDEQTT